MQENLFPEMSQKRSDNTKVIGANLSLIFNRRNKNLKFPIKVSRRDAQ
ncbi:MAG: hypothetical protein SRB2_02934 [Desulfobacteraceae bacterium Eth-SRB2]|nr:MAG: hypothetical protein SRB2_02934 [Desulfobacteraceae bacterium Eth-SRB2]